MTLLGKRAGTKVTNMCTEFSCISGTKGDGVRVKKNMCSSDLIQQVQNLSLPEGHLNRLSSSPLRIACRGPVWTRDKKDPREIGEG